MHVRDRGYEKLPPIVIQGSYTLPKNDGFDEDQLEEQVRSVIENLLLSGSESTMLVVTAFESFNEVEMKSYLLKPHKRSKIAQGNFWVIRKTSDTQSIFDNLWMFVKDKYFLCIHLVYDPKSLVKSFEPNSEDDLEK